MGGLYNVQRLATVVCRLRYYMHNIGVRYLIVVSVFIVCTIIITKSYMKYKYGRKTSCTTKISCKPRETNNEKPKITWIKAIGEILTIETKQ